MSAVSLRHPFGFYFGPIYYLLSYPIFLLFVFLWEFRFVFNDASWVQMETCFVYVQTSDSQ